MVCLFDKRYFSTLRERRYLSASPSFSLPFFSLGALDELSQGTSWPSFPEICLKVCTAEVTLSMTLSGTGPSSKAEGDASHWGYSCSRDIPSTNKAIWRKQSYLKILRVSIGTWLLKEIPPCYPQNHLVFQKWWWWQKMLGLGGLPSSAHCPLGVRHISWRLRRPSRRDILMGPTGLFYNPKSHHSLGSSLKMYKS